jgi:hypothetical protein
MAQWLIGKQWLTQPNREPPMADARLETQTSNRTAPAGLAGAARWLEIDDDVALGCECADPALQIERWGQEIQPFPLHAS